MGKSLLGVVAAVLSLLVQVVGAASVPEPDYYPLCSSPQPTAPLQVAGGGQIANRSGVAWNGKEYGVAWVDSLDSRLHFRRFFADGTPAAPAVIVSTVSSQSSYATSLVWNGSGYAVSWPGWSGSYWQTYFARLDSFGTLLGSPVKVSFAGVSETVGAYASVLAASGSGYAVTWYDNRTGNWDIYATLLDGSGAITYHDVAVCTVANEQSDPWVAWSSAVGKYEIVWQDYRSGSKYEVWGCQLTVGGVVGGTTSLVSDAAASNRPALADTGAGLGMVWHDSRDGNDEVYFSRLTAEGYKLGSDLRVTNQASFSNYPTVAWTGAEFGIFWSDYRGGNFDTWFQRVTAGGALAGSNTQATFTGGLIRPVASFARYGYLATGLYNYTAYGANYVLPWGCADDATPPTCPVNLVAYGVTGTTATIAWIPSVEDATDLAYYEVYRNSGLLAKTSDNYYADSGLGLNTTYNYYVRPVNAAQLVNGACSSASAIYVKTNATLTLMVDKSSPDAHLSWNDASMNNYNVFRGTSPQVMTQVGAAGSLSFNDPNVLMDNNLYFYTVDEPGW